MYEILSKEALNPTVVRITVQAPRIARKAEPGQFVILRAKEQSERIPLTVADYDREAGSVTVIYQIVGAGTLYEVVTQGFGGEIETNITFDADGRITAIDVRDAQETDGVGGVLTADGSDYINALIAGQDDLDGVDGVSDMQRVN